jgi:MFS family permease
MHKTSVSGLSRDFYQVQIAAFLNSVGTRCGHFAIAWWVLGKTGSPMAFSTFVAIGTLTDVLSRALCGWLGDQYERQRLLVWCYATSAMVTLVLATLSALDLYLPLLIGLCLGLSGISIGIRDPLQLSVAPALVPPERLGDALRLRSIVGSSSALMGPLAAGILLGPLGVMGTLYLNAFAGLVAWALIAKLRVPTSALGPRCRQVSYLMDWCQRTRQGFTALYRVKPEWRLSLLGFAVNFSLYPLFAVLFPVLINHYFSDDLWLIAVTEGAFALGLLVGSMALVARANHRWGRPRVVFAGFLSVGFAMVVCGACAQVFLDHPWKFASVTVPLLLMGGVGLVMVTVNTSTVRMLATPDNYRNRISSAASFVSGMVIPFGTVVGGLFTGIFGVSHAMVVLGAIIVLATVSSMFSTDLMQVLGMNDDQMRDVYRVIYPEAFPD